MRVEAFWGGYFCRVLAIVPAVVVPLLFCVLNSASGGEAVELPPEVAFKALWMGALISLPVFALPTLVALLSCGQPLVVLKRWFSLRHGVAWGRLLLLLVLLFLSTSALICVLTPAEEQATVQFLPLLRPGQLAFMGVILCLLVPVTEELLFRGVLLEVLPRPIATVGSALLFALAHGLSLYLFPLFLFGFWMALLARKTGSLVPGMLLHAGFNLIPLLLTDL